MNFRYIITLTIFCLFLVNFNAISFEQQTPEETNFVLNNIVEMKDAIIQQEQEKEKWYLLSIILIGILFISLIYVLILKNQKRKKELELKAAILKNKAQEEQLLNEKINTYKNQITYKNELINELENTVSNSPDFRNKKETLINRIAIENDWLSFMGEFNKIYKGYLPELEKKHPNLTKNDLKLGALTKLGLSNKEIADVLNITVDGVKKAKQRLKKKTSA